MAPMNPEFPRKLVELMRHYQKLQADNRALASILEYVQSEGHLPVEGWVAVLKELRQKPEYQPFPNNTSRYFVPLRMRRTLKSASVCFKP